MDMTNTIEPDSTQVNAEDFLSGPRTFTIANVRQGTSEQPVNIELVEAPGRAYRPSKTMRRVLVSAWGSEASAYTGRRLTLYRDPEVTFGRDKVGGIKIAAMSHIDKRLELMLTATRGKRAKHTVEPLIESQQPTSKPDPSKAIKWFADNNVPQSALEAHLSKPVNEWDADDLATLDRDRTELVRGGE